MSLKKSLVSSVLASSVALTGCGTGPAAQPAPQEGLHPIGTQAPAQEPSPTALATEVSGTRLLRYRTDTHDAAQPTDTFASPMSAFVLELGARRSLTVQQATDGTFRIPDAPAGEYFLQLGTTYVATDARSVNLDRYELGRRNPRLASSSVVPVKLSVTQLSPVSGSLYLMAYSSNAGVTADLSGGLPDDNTTSLTDWQVDYSDYSGSVGARIVDGTQGDRLSVYQLADRDFAGGGYYSALDRVLVPAPFTLSTDPAGPSVLGGAFEPAPQQEVAFEWWRSRFEAWRARTHPLAQLSPSSQQFGFYPTAWGSDAWYGYSGELAYGYVPVGYTDLHTRVSFGNPYFSWGVVGSVTHRFNVPVRLPGTTSGTLSVSLADHKPLHAFLAGPVTPRVSPPEEPQVDGLTAWQDRPLASLTPRLSWRAPRLGSPSAYRVRLYRLFTQSTSPTLTRYATVASFHTARTELTLPPGLLQAGQRYVAAITAYVTPGVDFARQPFALESLNDVASASTLTSVLSAPTTAVKGAVGGSENLSGVEGARPMEREVVEPSSMRGGRPALKSEDLP